LDFEGRGAKRVESENLVAYRVVDKDDNTISQGMVITLDISKTGIAIQSKEFMEADSLIELTLGMGEDVVKANGIVKNIKKISDEEYQVGIEFKFLTEEDLNIIGMQYPSILK
jgi:hypothetical protein